LGHIPLAVLLSAPKNLSHRWQAVFNALAWPVAAIHSILRNPDLAELSLEDHLAQLQFLRQARAGLERTVNELDELETVAPRTWKAGYAIRAAFLPVWAILEGGLFTRKAKAGSLVWQPIPAAEWPQVAPHVLERLVKRRDVLDEESLLTGLRDAVVAEKDIDLGGACCEAEQPLVVPGGAESTAAAGAAVRVIDQESLAIALLFQQPDWSIADIARQLAVDRKTLYKWPSFRHAAELKGLLKPRRPQAAAMPRGHKTCDGRVEAYADEDEGE
jgi:hypothetical protein